MIAVKIDRHPPAFGRKKATCSLNTPITHMKQDAAPQREREKERRRKREAHTCTSIYIYFMFVYREKKRLKQ